MFSLKNKTAIVTGGGSGIGKSICLLFASQGAKVFILDLDEKDRQVRWRRLTKTGARLNILFAR